MKNIVAICKLRLCQLKNNRKQLLLLILFPSLALLLVQQFVAETIEQVKLPIAFVDEDKSELSLKLANSLASISALDVVHTQYAEAEHLLLQHDVDVVIHIEAGFEERILQAETDALITLIHSPMSLSTGAMKEVIAANVMKFVSNSLAADYVLDLAKEYSPATLVYEERLFDEAWEKTNAQWEPSPPLELVVLGDKVMIVPIESEERERGQSGVFLLVTMILILGAYFAILSLDAKEQALLKRLAIYRVKKRELFVGHLLAFAVILIILSILPTIIVHMTMNTTRLLLSVLLCILFSASLFYSLSTFFVKKSLFAWSCGLLILSSLLLSMLPDASPQRIVHSFLHGGVSIENFVCYFGIGTVVSFFFLLKSSRREREKVC